mmetsp:Transcript_20317/g.38219  ORF Transcript_20317/g.38219 Transcript_20317/m.38219 type:complete len:120 (+) Transcript_20317:95-454(+)
MTRFACFLALSAACTVGAVRDMEKTLDVDVQSMASKLEELERRVAALEDSQPRPRHCCTYWDNIGRKAGSDAEMHFCVTSLTCPDMVKDKAIREFSTNGLTMEDKECKEAKPCQSLPSD